MKQILLFLAIFYGVMANTSAQTFEVGSIKYNVVSAVSPFTVEVVAKTPIYSGVVTIPAQVTNGATTYSVIRIGQQAFQNCVGLTSVTMPNSVTDINLSAFAGCTALTNVVFSTSLKNIKGYAFTGCSSLPQITLPSSLLLIDNYAFRGCILLTTVTIPASVTTIGVGTFAKCASLTSFTVNASNTTYKAVNGAILTINGTTLIQAPTGVVSFEIPIGVTSLANNALAECTKLEIVFMPTNLSSIGESAFSNCTLLDSIYCNAATPPTVANANTFLNVPANAAIFVPSTTINTYKAATYWMGFANIAATPTPTEFVYNGLKYSVSLATPTIVEVIENTTKYKGDIVIPEQAIFNYQSYTVNCIGRGAFEGSYELKSIIMPNTIIEIKDFAFMHCIAMVTAQLSTSLQKIGESAFMRCYVLKDITLPTSLTEIGEWAFNACSKITDLTIPIGTTKIGAGSLSSNSSLNNLILENGNTAYKQVDGAIYTIDGDTLIYVPAQVTSYAFPPTLKYIDKIAFGGCSLLTSLTIPSTIQHIDINAFEGCSGLKEVTIPPTISKITSGMFIFCTGLTTVNFPANLDEIGTNAFYSCSSLKTVNVPSGVTSISYQAFYNTGLTSFYINASTPPLISNATFVNVPRTIPIYVPEGSVAAYKAANYWNEFTNINPIAISLETSDYKDITIPNSIYSVLKIENLVTASVVELFNTTGTLLIKEEVNNSLAEINAATLSKGIYVVRVTQTGQTKSFKVIKN